MLIPLLLSLTPLTLQDSDAPAWSRLRAAPLEGPSAADATAAIDGGLAWLADRQLEDGSWGADPGTSALAVLAFLSRRAEGDTLDRGLEHLAGALESVADPRDGALLALALVEAAVLGREDLREDLREGASRALARFAEVPDADLPTPVFAWRALAATLGDEAGIAGGPRIADVRAELSRRSRASGAVERSRDDPGDRFRGVGAVLLARTLLGDGNLAEAQAERLTDRRARPAWPSSSETADVESWAWGAAATARLGDEARGAYLTAVREALLYGRGDDGSWPDLSEEEIGREASTALAVLAFAGPVRYAPAPPVATRPAEGAPDRGMIIGIGGGAGGKFGGRFGSRKAVRGTDGRAVQKAVAESLAWLVDAQGADGSWADGDLGATGLALLALQGDGNTLGHGTHKDAVTRGIQWLRESQDRDTGRFGDGPDLDRAVATAAFAECYYFSKSPLLRVSLVPALADLETLAETEDEVVSAWVATAVVNAIPAKAPVPETLRAAVEARYAPGAASPERIAPAVLLRALLHEAGPESEWRSALESLVPTQGTDPMDLFFGAFASFQVGGDVWRAWDEACRPIVLGRIGEDGDAGGVRETALAALTLEVYFRYGRAIGGR